MSERLELSATAKVRLTKINEDGSKTVEEHTVSLTEKEARDLWLSQQQA